MTAFYYVEIGKKEDPGRISSKILPFSEKTRIGVKPIF